MKSAPMIKRILHFLLTVFVLLLPCLAFAEEPIATPTDPACGTTEFEAGEIIIEFKEGIPQASVQSLLLEPNHIVQIAEPIAVEPHYGLRAPDVIPNDPRYQSQWSLPQIEAPAAWDITTGSDKVVIAFVDSGVDLAHPELKDKIWTNPGEIPGNEIDDDGNGYVDDVHGWDFVNWHGEPQDDYWHGTFVSSIAAAMTNNGDGMAGVSWGVEIMPVKAMPHDWLYPNPGHLTGAIYYAANNGAKIINLSWQLTGSDYPQALQTAVNYAHSRGALVVAAAGDTFTNTHKYPASLDHVVSVAATDRYDEHPGFSTYNDKVDVAAPGVDILGIFKDTYAIGPSTDAAAAHVSGLAALIWSVNPTLTNDELEGIIESSAVDMGEPGRDDYFGHGRIDARAAIMTTTHYLKVEPDILPPFLVCDDGSPPLQKITNPNTNSSTWTATPTVPWLSISLPEGYTPSSAMVSVDKGGLPHYGVYTAAITATSTLTWCGNNPTTIPVTVTYASQCSRNYLPLLFKNHDSY